MQREVDRSTFANVERGGPSNGTILSSTLAKKKDAKIEKNRSQSRKIGVRKPSIARIPLTLTPSPLAKNATSQLRHFEKPKKTLCS